METAWNEIWTYIQEHLRRLDWVFTLWVIVFGIRSLWGPMGYYPLASRSERSLFSSWRQICVTNWRFIGDACFTVVLLVLSFLEMRRVVWLAVYFTLISLLIGSYPLVMALRSRMRYVDAPVGPWELAFQDISAIRRNARGITIYHKRRGLKYWLMGEAYSYYYRCWLGLDDFVEEARARGVPIWDTKDPILEDGDDRHFSLG